MAKRPDKRRRGGASLPCVLCQGDTRVRYTRRVTVGGAGGGYPVVDRQRECLRRRCRYRFLTREQLR